MKKGWIILTGLFLLSCSSVDECFQSSGAMQYRSFSTEAFDKILVMPGVELVVEQGEEYRVELQAGENLIDNVHFVIADGELRLVDDNSCNLTRNFQSSTIKVTTPTLTAIHSYSEKTVRNIDTLRFPSLRLYGIETSHGSGVGDFDLVVDTGYLSVESNFVSQFKVSGKSHMAYIGFYHGISRYDGANLQTKKTVVYHRGSNDVIVRVSDTLQAELRSTGDLISKTPTLYKAIDRTYTGQFIESYD